MALKRLPQHGQTPPISVTRVTSGELLRQFRQRLLAPDRG